MALHGTSGEPKLKPEIHKVSLLQITFGQETEGFRGKLPQITFGKEKTPHPATILEYLSFFGTNGFIDISQIFLQGIKHAETLAY